MKTLNLTAIAVASTLCLSLNAQADNNPDQWGSWGSQHDLQEDLVAELEVSESELIQADVILSDINTDFIMGTQLAGAPGDGIDTAIELGEDGIPVDFHPEEINDLEALPTDDFRSEEELGALDSPMVNNIDSDLAEGFPVNGDRSNEELGALESYMVDNAH